MDLKPTKGLKVIVQAHREAIFGDDSVQINKIAMNNGNNLGVMTGMVLAGYCEVEMQKLDGRKHWYPIEELKGEHGESVVEEEIPIELDEDGAESEEETA